MDIVELRNKLEKAAMFRMERSAEGPLVRVPTSPEEQLLCRTRIALQRRRRCDFPPVTAYRLDPTLAKFMRALALVEVLEKAPGELAPADERSPSGRSKPVHVHLLCELTAVGKQIADTF